VLLYFTVLRCSLHRWSSSHESSSILLAQANSFLSHGGMEFQ
jgi:hypothetical protein